MIEWKDIPGYEGFYQASNTGLIKSLDREVMFKNGHTKKLKGRILALSKDKYGYYQVSLCRNIFDQKWIKIHRLIAITFIENPNNLPQVNHIDGCKTNNFIGNLEWINGSGNHRHATLNGLKAKGIKHGKSKITDNEVRMIRNAYNKKNVTQKEISEKFGISVSQTNSIINKRNWKHIK